MKFFRILGFTVPPGYTKKNGGRYSVAANRLKIKQAVQIILQIILVVAGIFIPRSGGRHSRIDYRQKSQRQKHAQDDFNQTALIPLHCRLLSLAVSCYVYVFLPASRNCQPFSVYCTAKIMSIFHKTIYNIRL